MIKAPYWIGVGYRTAKRHYQLFSDPIIRGSNFSWLRFPRMMSRVTWNTLFCYSRSRLKYIVFRPFAAMVAFGTAVIVARKEIHNAIVAQTQRHPA